MAAIGSAAIQLHVTGREIHIGVNEREEGIEVTPPEGFKRAVVLLDVLF